MMKLENVPKSVVVKYPHGEYIFKLGSRLSDKNISINQLMRDFDIGYNVINRLMRGKVTRPDLFFIDKLCHYFDCEFTDIIEYVRK